MSAPVLAALTQLSTGGFLLGLLALAGLLFLLQRLRVRHREVVVPTTMFWREAVQEQRARTLVERFRHPWMYALALLVAGLLWLGVARPDADRSDGTRHVLLLDASAGMAARGRFDRAVLALEAELERAPRDRTEVLLCGEQIRTLLAPGEDRALLRTRLADARPAPVPSSLERAIASRAALAADEELPTRFCVLGDGPVTAALAASLPEQVLLERADLGAPGEGGRGLVALGVAPAASGDWTRVDAFVEYAPGADGASPPAARIDGVDWPRSAGAGTTWSGGREAGADTVQVVLPGLPAAGGLLEVRLDDPAGSAGDDVVELRLPDRPRIRVALAGDAPGLAVLRGVLVVDPAVELVADAAAADVVVGDAVDGAPALTLAPAATQEEAILVGHAAGADPADVLHRAVGELGLDRVDAAALADALGRTIALGAAPMPARRVSLWSELLEEDAGLVESRAFPLLVGRAVRWLADVESIVPYRAAGRPVPRRAGEAPAAVVLAAVLDGEGGLLDRATTLPRSVTGAADLDASAPEGPGPWRPYTWFLLLAFALLGVEWALFQRGRMA